MKYKGFIKVWVVFITLLISGCVTRGPMESFYGPIETPNYTELLRGSVINDDEKIISASEGTSAVGMRAIGGAVLVSDKRVFFAQWSTDLLKYYTVYSVNYNDIKSYGMCSPLASTVSLIGKVFCVNDGTEEVLFATEQVDSILYEIKRHNSLAKREDD